MTRDELSVLVETAANELDGDWLLLGGALVAMWLNVARTTEDIDLIGVPGTLEQRYALNELCLRRGLPVELVNTAADFFVRRISDWQSQLVLFRQGTKARIFRPSTTLFLLLKLQRITESDLADCTAWLAHDEREPCDAPRVVAAIDALPASDDASLRERRRVLREQVLAA